MTEQELRALVQDAVSRHLSGGAGRLSPPRTASSSPPPSSGHASHARFASVTGGDADGRCLIEPAVACTHCGYCTSYGH